LKADSAALVFYGSKDGKISGSYRAWNQGAKICSMEVEKNSEAYRATIARYG